MKLKKKQSYSVQEWIPISKIEDGIIYLSTGVKIYITEVEPINFKLKSNSEQIMILENYKKLLKSIDFDIQIIMVSKKTEVSKHLDTIIKNTKDNEKIKLISQDYINLIRDISAVRGSISRKFYIIFKHDNSVEEKIQMITEGLGRCGNSINLCSKDDIKLLLNTFFNKRLINMGARKD